MNTTKAQNPTSVVTLEPLLHSLCWLHSRSAHLYTLWTPVYMYIHPSTGPAVQRAAHQHATRYWQRQDNDVLL
jgi:hypothetical protein